jgi:microcin C transport system substrate-binding protein
MNEVLCKTVNQQIPACMARVLASLRRHVTAAAFSRGPMLPALFQTLLLAVVLTACGSQEKKALTAQAAGPLWKAPRVALADQPAWVTNTDDPTYASPEAQKGGTLKLAILSFPLTFRTVGPDSNSSFRDAILGNQLGLTGIHPNTERIVPEIATHWAFGSDKKTMFFKLNPAARWSDGVPVTADDFAYTLVFMRAKHIVAPWYNDYYTKEIERIDVFDDHTLAVVSTKAEPDLHLKLSINPTPRHFYGELGPDFVRRFNWKIAPNTGAYQISEFKKGRFVKFKRVKNWWAADLHYFRHRFNADRVIFTVVRDHNMMWEYFKKARIDVFGLTLPEYWHVKSRMPAVAKGYVERIWFFNDTQQSAQGLWLNQDREIFKDRNVRYAFAHAMNVEKVIEKVLRGDYFRLEQGFMGYGRYTNTAIRARRFDLDKVEQLMTQSGWQRGADGVWAKSGMRFAVEVVYSQDAHTPRLVVLREEAKKAGLELNLQRLDPAANYKKVMEKNHDVAWSGWSTSLRPQYWEHFHSENAHKPQTNNITNTDDPELDRLIDAYRQSLEEQERIALSLRIQEKVHGSLRARGVLALVASAAGGRHAPQRHAF